MPPSPSLRAAPLLVRRGMGMPPVAKPPLLLLGSADGGPGIALPSTSLLKVFRRPGVAKSSSRDSSTSICDTLAECPCP